MRYTLIPDYFQTPLFQQTVSEYLDQVVPGLLKKGAARQAKGRFKGNVTGYDMPYHIHILHGLIPMLYLYERYLIQQNGIEHSHTPLYLRVLILGFTFHDANKLSDTEDIRLEDALHEWQAEVATYELESFLPGYSHYLNDIAFLALGTERQTRILRNQFPIQLEYKGMNRLTEYCHLADSLASLTDFDDLPTLFQRVHKTLAKAPGEVPMPLSWIRLRGQPYTLLSQRLLAIARQVCHSVGKPVLYATREGFIFWGEHLTQEETEAIISRMGEPMEEVDPLNQVKINFQKCSLGFLGSIPFTQQIAHQIIETYQSRFLDFSPNSAGRFEDFPSFVELLNSLSEAYTFPVALEQTDTQIRFSFPAEPDETEDAFIRLFCMKKFQYLNKAKVKRWKKDWELALQTPLPLITPLEIGTERVTTFQEWVGTLSTHTSQTSYIGMTAHALIWAWQIQQEGDEEDWEEIYEAGLAECVAELEPETTETPTAERLSQLARTWLQTPSHDPGDAFSDYSPYVPTRHQRCAFTGGRGDKAYKEVSAFALRARSASPHSVTTLKNDTHYISTAFAEENQLRKELFPKTPDADLIVYYDFFETHLGISTDILRALAKAKTPKAFEGSVLEIDHNARFRYDLMLNFTSLASMRGSASEALFWFVRSHLQMLRDYGIRTYVAGTMSPYRPHRAAFYYEDAPPLLKALGWQEVRLDTLQQVWDEIGLLLRFEGTLTGNLHRVAQSRNAYFRFFYEQDKKKQDQLLKPASPLVQFIHNYPTLFPHMTTMDHLVTLALPLKLGFRSGADETGLIRTALHYLRVNLKEGGNREQAIQQMAAAIDRDLKSESRMRKDQQALDFATAVYDQLYGQAWHSQLLSLNREKDWIYQFGFLFRRASYEVLDQKKADRAEAWLRQQQRPLSLEAVQDWTQQDPKAQPWQAPHIFALLQTRQPE